ncbi:proprotein convertase subtilisin/kexin type 7 isoform X3 [Ornithorhynchus anatinus]|uniref:proprotein convertase subtilisin/kexin type 7 isoform X3 n=1 Tax=Ornithorhynchus anatinus TaxID=9258 RepID=UPI0010A7AF89|nr:proprotein convertase subtilisin/kexin type 7 isoform X3 [Ornithorhynchus anatinus]
MPRGRWKEPPWSVNPEPLLGLPPCLWLALAGVSLLAPRVSGLPEPDGTEARGSVGLSWAVHLDGAEGEEEGTRQRADALARAAGLVNAGRIGELRGHYLFTQPAGPREDGQEEAARRRAEEVLAGHEAVRWHAEQRLLKRAKRGLHFNDPKFPQQWHLNNRRSPGRDINVTGVWERNVTGRGVTVVVVDDGVEHTIQDIQPNYSPEGSYDLNSNDPDPMPHPDEENGNHHGTRCAGEIAAVPNNSFCAVGVAFGSRIAGIRVLDGPLTDSMEAVAFNKHYQINDIYSCSWGPDDDGKTVDGPHQLGKAALQHGVMAGRHGFGSIFVVASGNGGQHSDNCNYDGYANSIYTITIGDHRLGPAEGYRLHGGPHGDVGGGPAGRRHDGLDAAGAALSDVERCAAHHRLHSHQVRGPPRQLGHQPGRFQPQPPARLRPAQRLEARQCRQASYVSPVLREAKVIPLAPRSLEVVWNVSHADLALSGLRTLEHVAVTVTISHPRRGSLDLRLSCPSGMLSLIGAPRSLDSDPGGFDDWTFSTVRCWGEGAQGQYRLSVRDVGDRESRVGILERWQLTLYGSAWNPQEVEERRRLLEDAMSGKYLHDGFSLPCPPGLDVPEEDGYSLTPNTLKTLMLLGCFAVFWTAYYLLEVCLSQRDLAFDLACGGAPCLGSRNRHQALEEGMELEAAPLYENKDVEETEGPPDPPNQGSRDREGTLAPALDLQEVREGPAC